MNKKTAFYYFINEMTYFTYTNLVCMGAYTIPCSVLSSNAYIVCEHVHYESRISKFFLYTQNQQ